MLKIEFTGQFRRDYKFAIKRGCDLNKLNKIISILCNEQSLPEIYQDHALINSKNYKGVRVCHIQPDWLLVYKISQNILVLRLIRTGTYSDLFK